MTDSARPVSIDRLALRSPVPEPMRFAMSKRSTLILVALVGFLAGLVLAPAVPLLHAQEPKVPKWSHAMELKVRKAGMGDFKDADKIGIEVFRDENNGNLIYISQTGSISVVKAQ